MVSAQAPAAQSRRPIARIRQKKKDKVRKRDRDVYRKLYEVAGG